MMKNILIKLKYYVLSLVVAILCFSSCSLEEDPTSFVAPENYYKTVAQCISGLNSCYIPLKSIYTYQYLIATEGVTDLMHIRSGTQDAYLDISPTKPLFGGTMWTQGYKGVMYCNSVIAGIKRAPVSEEDKLPLLAEGMVMRAYYYWMLTSTFGDVPFYTVDVATTEILLEVGRLGRMSADKTRDYLIDELLQYLPGIKQVRTSDVEGNRSGAAMGWILVAKMAQWNKKWDVARDALLKLEEIYGSLSQYPLEDIMFRNKNTAESIFEIQHQYVAGGLNYTTSCAAICTPRPRTGQTSIYDGVEIPELGDEATLWTPLRPNKYFFQALQSKRSGDKRLDINLAWLYNGKQFLSVAKAPWIGPKFWCPGMVHLNDSNNQKVFRYADAILMLAECYTELKDSDMALKYLNMVKQRAGLMDYTFKTWEALLEEVQKERGRELLGEFQRKYDLVRWGIYFQMITDYNDHETVKENVRPCHEYYPIPDKEVIYSGGALDNDAYDKYGL